MSDQPKNLFQKISQVMQDVSYLSKDDNIAFGNTKYKAISEEKVTSTLRQSLIANGLVILPFEQEASKEGNISFVNTKYKIVDIDTGQYEVLASSGEGADTQDKGVGKAMTYAYKYMLLRTFAIPTGEDPDKISSAELDEKEKKQKEAEKKQQQTDIPPAALKAKYQTGKGSLDGFEEWVADMQAKGHNFKTMEETLAKALAKKKQEEKQNAQ
jgi:hypothetical protein